MPFSEQRVELRRGETLVVSFAADPVTEPLERLQDEVDRLQAAIKDGYEPWVRDAIDNNVLLRLALKHVREKLEGMAGDGWEEVAREVCDYIATVTATSKDRTKPAG